MQPLERRCHRIVGVKISRKLVVGAAVICAIATAVYLLREKSDLVLLEDQPGVVRVLSIKSALREPMIDRSLPLVGRVTWPKREPDREAIQNMARRNPNLAGVAILDSLELDMVPRLEIDGLEHPLISDNSFRAHLVGLPMVFGNKPKKAILKYGSLEPIALQLPPNGRPVPWSGDKVINLNALKVHLLIPPISVPTKLIQARVFLEGGSTGQVYRLADRSGAVLVSSEPVAYSVFLGESPTQLLTVSPVSQSKLELTAEVRKVSGGKILKLVSPHGTVWFEAAREVRQTWFKAIPRPDGSVVQVIGTPFGISPPEMESPKSSVTLEEMWKAIEPVQNGQKFAAILYKPHKPIALGTMDLRFLDPLRR